MNSSDRRQAILNLLRNYQETIKGSELAERFEVSRQVIVQDIAVLRASGEQVVATPQGYIMISRSGNSDSMKKTIATKHQGNEAIDEELKIIVDNGGKILDVIVEHPVYGEIRGNLMITTRHDIEDFMSRLLSENAEPLCSLTEGVHLHTVDVPDEEAFERIISDLKRKGYLFQEV